jgi:hypothetical protein
VGEPVLLSMCTLSIIMSVFFRIYFFQVYLGIESESFVFVQTNCSTMPCAVDQRIRIVELCFFVRSMYSGTLSKFIDQKFSRKTMAIIHSVDALF